MTKKLQYILIEDMPKEKEFCETSNAYENETVSKCEGYNTYRQQALEKSREITEEELVDFFYSQGCIEEGDDKYYSKRLAKAILKEMRICV